MRKHLLAGGLIALSLLGTAVANADPVSKTPMQCFYSNDWSGWKATPDSKSIYIRVGVNKLYRLDLSSACPALQAPNSHLITDLHGSSSICSALDLDMRVSDGTGFATPCIVSEITPLTAAEATALPKDLRP
jgi:hypothetical protein